jgi:Putative Actinobacterial Holin-X, holin superfamily III
MKIKEKLYNYLKIDDLKGNVSSFVEAKIELLRMDVEDRFIEGIVKVVYVIIQVLLLLLVLIFALILVANLLNSWLDSTWKGYGIVFLVSIIPFIVWNLAKEKATSFIRTKAIHELEKANQDLEDE